MKYLERDCETNDCFETHSNAHEAWQQISLCYSEGSFKEAHLLLNKFLGEIPNDPEALQLKDELVERYNRAEQLYNELENELESDELADLINYLKQIDQIYPDHPSSEDIKSKLALRAGQFRKAMEKGLVSLKNKDWETAFELLKKALQLNTSVINIKPLIEKLGYISEIRRQMNQSILQNNQQEARRCARLYDYLADELGNLVPALRNREVTDEL